MEASSGTTMEVTGTSGTINLRHADADLTSSVHLLPCCIRQDGPCFVSQYFKPKLTGVEIDKMQVEEAFFRGRRLHGTSISLPEQYRGYVLKKKNSVSFEDSEDAEGNSNQWETCAEFGNFKYWNHDDIPSQDDAIVRSLQWLTVANATKAVSFVENNPVMHQRIATTEITFRRDDTQMHKPVAIEDLAPLISKDHGQ